MLTYNVNGKDSPDDLSGLFDFQRLGDHDIFVIALEELSLFSIVSWEPYMAGFDQVFKQRGYVRLIRSRWMVTSLSIFVPRNKITDFHHVKVWG